MADTNDAKVIYTHLDSTFQTTVSIVEQKTEMFKNYYVEISCLHSGTEVTIPCPTKRSAEIVSYWFIRGLAHA